MAAFNLSAYKILFTEPDRIEYPYAWVGHIPFAFFIVNLKKPKLIVELGVHGGNSYNAFCQAVKGLGLDTICYGVDTRKDGEYAGIHPEEVYHSLNDYQQANYSSFSTLLKTSFNEALEYFSYNSIDILHIDGCYTYETVKYYFESWLPKMKTDGVIILHDICERSGHFGVWRLWQEIKDQYSTIEFTHSHGLGVVFLDCVSEEVNEFLYSFNQGSFLKLLFQKIGTDIKQYIELIGNNAKLEASVNNNLLEIEQKIRELAVVKHELNQIYASHFWNLATKYYQLRDNVWPINLIHKSLKTKRLKSGDQRHIKQAKFQPSINLAEVYSQYDILFFSIIDWHFRYQRPQHIANYFSDQGHRVFYFNAHVKDSDTMVHEIKDNLFNISLGSLTGNSTLYNCNFNLGLHFITTQIDELIKQFNIRDCIVVVEYPIWCPIVNYLKDTYNYFVLYDYLDLYSGFLTNNDLLEQKDHNLMQISDLVIVTSEYLYDHVSAKKQNMIIIRNGTDFDHFNKVDSESVALKKGNPVIGYYGAIAEWFDSEIIIKIAAERPSWDIVLIGEASLESQHKFKKFNNIKLLGEKDYLELPKYLHRFDVCVIPFNARSNLIKATNPVKFYEFLSAGKKIVATEIPELLPYKDKYVYLTNNSTEFIKYIEACLDNKDILAKEEERIAFARDQDWSLRCNEIESAVLINHKLVSIIIVTYNNLDLTMNCLDSIFRKTAHPNYEIIIIDNNSQDGTRDYLNDLTKNHSNISVLLNDQNSGFAKANNQGIEKARGEYLIFLNNDTIVTRGWITNLVKHLDKNPNLGMVCPVTNSIGNEAKINVNYRNLEQMEEFANSYTRDHFNQLYEDINVLALFCVAIKREVIERIGCLDESFGLGMFEDDDYSYRLKEEGYKIACAEDVFIHHYGGASFKKMQDKEYEKLFNKNKIIFENKWKMKWIPHIYREGVK